MKFLTKQQKIVLISEAIQLSGTYTIVNPVYNHNKKVFTFTYKDSSGKYSFETILINVETMNLIIKLSNDIV